MCGIALLVSGIRIDLSSLHIDSISSSSKTHQYFSLDDLKAALQRRGPDSLGMKKLLLPLHSNTSNSGNSLVPSFTEQAHVLNNGSNMSESFAELVFLGATLQLRGVAPVSQPLVDSSRNILVYNGEIFGGIEVGSDKNDTEIIMQFLGNCCSCRSQEHRTTCDFNGQGKGSVLDVLSVIKGPWAIIYWQESSKTLWFGRDAFGRRSLLVHWPTMEDPRFLLSSVSPTSSNLQDTDFEVENGTDGIKFWEELSCGIYSMSVDATKSDGSFFSEIKKHEWTNVMLKELIEWERVSIEPKPSELTFSRSRTSSAELDISSTTSVSVLVQNVLTALRESLVRRISLRDIYQAEKETVPVAVLFSGGLDSMIIAALLDQCLDPNYEIDLLNVSFDGEYAPDRISSKAGVKELRMVAPLRRWRLVHIDADLSKLTWETKRVLSLINPANTYMDLNIGIALWLAARGEGWTCEESNNGIDEDKHVNYNYTSRARILLVGSGADEQCAGYGRHRTKYRHESWLGLHKEMKLDMQRIWKRNLGRDDRCIADNGKEARFPFLDEDVIRTLLDIPLWEVADLDQPSGKGDKKILREVAQMLGLHNAGILPKRAIQFGSRIARESNRKNFGSNRAANQASAGSVGTAFKFDWHKNPGRILVLHIHLKIPKLFEKVSPTVDIQPIDPIYVTRI